MRRKPSGLSFEIIVSNSKSVESVVVDFLVIHFSIVRTPIIAIELLFSNKTLFTKSVKVNQVRVTCIS